MLHGVTLGDISMSILSLGAFVSHCIQRIDSRYAIGGDGRTSAGIAVVLGGLFSPQAARDGIASADASDAVRRRRHKRCVEFLRFSARAEPMV